MVVVVVVVVEGGQHTRLISRIWAVVGGAMVDAETGGEAGPGNQRVALGQAVVARQRPDRVLDALGDLGQPHARLDGLLGPLAHLPMDLGALAKIVEAVVVHPL